MSDDCNAMAIALITANQANDFDSMAALLNTIPVANVAGIIASLTGLAVAFMEHCAECLEITPDVLLHTIGIENATWPQ